MCTILLCLYIRVTKYKDFCPSYKHKIIMCVILINTDRELPQLRVTSIPPRYSNQTQWTFTFQCTDLTPCTTECTVHQLGSPPNFQSCQGEWSASGFGDGDLLEFSLRGQDDAGNSAAPMNYRWTVGNHDYCDLILCNTQLISIMTK